MHDVQALIRFGVPLTTARTVWMFGVQRRFERTLEWLIDFPNCGFFPQMSQTADMQPPVSVNAEW